MLQKSQPRDIDQSLIKEIVDQVENIVLILSDFVRSIRLISRSIMTSQLVFMKLVAILVILYRSAHWNNNNYISLFITVYLYLAGVKIDIITLFNHLGLFILHNVLLKKLREITKSNATWIKVQVSNYRLVGSWDNFEYQEKICIEKGLAILLSSA